MPVDVHGLMQNADDVDSRCCLPEENHVRADQVLEIAVSYIDWPAQSLTRCQALEGAEDVIEIDFGLIQ